jgi:hypothetical protein
MRSISRRTATDFIRLSVKEVVETLDRGDHARRHRDVRLPAELARGADPGDRGAGRAARHVRYRRLPYAATRSTR